MFESAALLQQQQEKQEEEEKKERAPPASFSTIGPDAAERGAEAKGRQRVNSLFPPTARCQSAINEAAPPPPAERS